MLLLYLHLSITDLGFPIPTLESGRSHRHLCSQAGTWSLICQQTLQEGVEKMVKQDESDKKGSWLE